MDPSCILVCTYCRSAHCLVSSPGLRTSNITFPPTVFAEIGRCGCLHSETTYKKGEFFKLVKQDRSTGTVTVVTKGFFVCCFFVFRSFLLFRGFFRNKLFLHSLFFEQFSWFYGRVIHTCTELSLSCCFCAGLLCNLLQLCQIFC